MAAHVMAVRHGPNSVGTQGSGRLGLGRVSLLAAAPPSQVYSRFNELLSVSFLTNSFIR